MARTYRDIAIEEMLRTVEEAMHRVVDGWGVLPPPMEEAIDQFRTQLGAAIDSPPRYGEWVTRRGKRAFCPLVPSFCSVLRSHPFAPAARCKRRRLERRSRTRGNARP